MPQALGEPRHGISARPGAATTSKSRKSLTTNVLRHRSSVLGNSICQHPGGWVCHAPDCFCTPDSCRPFRVELYGLPAGRSCLAVALKAVEGMMANGRDKACSRDTRREERAAYAHFVIERLPAGSGRRDDGDRISSRPSAPAISTQVGRSNIRPNVQTAGLCAEAYARAASSRRAARHQPNHASRLSR